MKKKRSYAILIIAMMVFSAGCGNTEDASKTETVMTEGSASEAVETEEPDAVDKETAEPGNPSTEVKDIDSMIVEKEDSELGLKEYYYSMEDRTLCDDGNDIFSSLPFESAESINNYVTTGNVPIYAENGVRIGYTKENVDISAIGVYGDWCYFYLDRDRRYARISDIVANSITMDERDAIVMAEEAEKQKAATQTQTPAGNVPSGQPVVNTPTGTEPIEQPVNSDKYTPEEAIAVFRECMEAGGMTWNPELKGNWDETVGLYPIEEWNLHMKNYFGGSWGTGWLYLDKGYPEEAASSDLESAAIGNGGGRSWTEYYLEVTGSDENCVDYIIWAE